MLDKTSEVPLTPPMGWNSWNCYGTTVTQEKIEKQARAIIETSLREHGFTYINIDDGWQGAREGPYNAIQGNSKFPDMQGLCDHVHELGLKIGIYSTPMRISYGGHRGGYAREVEDATQWAEWGIDFLKYDWSMSDPLSPTIEWTRRMRDALDAVDRNIVFSLSNSTPFSKVAILSKYANMWRTTGDVTDTWKRMSEIGFTQNRWGKFAGPGHWNDPDMIVLGQVGITEVGDESWGRERHPTRLSKEEQRTHMTLWCILAAPLLLGCDLTQLDSFTSNLLTNDEVLSVNQDPLGTQGYRVRKEGKKEVWMKPLYGRKKAALSFFNRGEATSRITVKWKNIGYPDEVRVRDLWHHKDLGTISKSFSESVAPHGAEMYLIKSTLHDP